MPGDHRMIPIARDGWRFILPLAALCAVSFALSWVVIGAIFFVLAAFSAFFFRDPARAIPECDDMAVSPADGKVIAIEEVTDDRFPDGKAVKVGIFLSVLNVHINRAPADGAVRSTRYVRGRFHNALFDKASDENEHNVIALDSPVGYIEIKQIAGVIARRIVCFCRQGDAVKRGERIGLIRFGSRTEVLLPAGMEIWVKIGSRVYAGATPLGRLKVARAPRS